MRISTGLVFQNSLNALLDQQSRLMHTQQQIATGKRIMTPADDPAGSASLLGVNQSLQVTHQYQDNITTARNQLERTESTLASVNDILDRVRELTLQANNATISAADRRMIAVEMRQNHDALIDLANTQNGSGEYLFAGYQGLTRPYASDPQLGVVYHGDSGQRFVQVGASRQVAVGYPGSEVFQAIPRGNGVFVTRPGDANTGTGIIDSGSVLNPNAWDRGQYTITFSDAGNYTVEDGNGDPVADGVYAPGTQIVFSGVTVRIEGTPAAGDTFTVAPSTRQDLFTTINDMIVQLESEPGATTSATMANATNGFLSDLDQAMENMRSLRAQTGARLAALDAQEDINAESILRLDEIKSGIEDLDYATAITSLSRQLVGLDAAQKSFLQIQGLSLFNYL